MRHLIVSLSRDCALGSRAPLLSLRSNGIGADGIQSLANALARNTELHELELSRSAVCLVFARPGALAFARGGQWAADHLLYFLNFFFFAASEATRSERAARGTSRR
jgi:hypothetical protein